MWCAQCYHRHFHPQPGRREGRAAPCVPTPRGLAEELKVIPLEGPHQHQGPPKREWGGGGGSRLEIQNCLVPTIALTGASLGLKNSRQASNTYVCFVCTIIWCMLQSHFVSLYNVILTVKKNKNIHNVQKHTHTKFPLLNVAL